MADENEWQPQRAEEVLAIPLLEKLIAISGLLLVVFVLGVMLYEAETSDDKPPEIIVSSTRIDSQANGYLVHFRAENKGSSATAELLIEGRLGEGEGAEASSVTLDYVPAHSHREGGLFFTRKPDGLKLRALGYQKP